MLKIYFFIVLVLVSGVELNRLGGEEHEHHHEHEEDHGVEAHEHAHEHDQEPRDGRVESGLADLENQIFNSVRTLDPSSDSSSNTIDFSGAVPVLQADGSTKLCVEKLETREEVKKDPLLECVHKSVEKCHYTYKTQFVPVQEEVCDDNYVKHCTIMYKQIATNETYTHCYKPLVKDCTKSNEPAKEICRDYFESSCTTKYVEKSPGKHVADTSCEKIPVRLCGDSTCRMVEGKEECHDKVTVSIVDQPEEHCDLTPQKTCRHKTTLVPKLQPSHECTNVPREVCSIKYVNTRVEKVPFKSLWCQDESEVETETGVLSEGVELPEEPDVLDGYVYEVLETPLQSYRPTVTAPAEAFTPPPPPPPKTAPSTTPRVQVVALTPESLEAAVLKATKQAIINAVTEATALADSEESKRRLTVAVNDALVQAVKASLKKAVASQVSSNKPPSASSLEITLQQGIRAAVENSVRNAVVLRSDKMSSTMEAELLSMKNSIELALINAVRQAVQNSVRKAFLTKSISSEKENTIGQQQLTENNVFNVNNQKNDNQATISASIQQAVLLAVQRAVQLSLQRQTEVDRQGARLAIQQAVNQAVALAIKNRFSSSYSVASELDVKSAVEKSVMKYIESAVLETTSRTRATQLQKDALSAALRQAVKQAVERSVTTVIKSNA